ncbi:MAG TPA: hypothetical protein VF666_02925 [Pyrinomonadaceae bacterium]|jgi:hypothetical protein
MANIGLYALPFGFGPASKAIAVAQAVNERSSQPVHWTFVSSGIGLELIRRSGLQGSWCDTGKIDADEALADHLAEKLDAMIVVMHRQWAHLLAPRLPVFCVDSLAHMWHPDAFDKFAGFRHIKRYYVQDLFGASEAMRRTGVPHVVAVSPIMAKPSGRGTRWPGRPIIHLGGLLTPFTDERVDVYVAGIIDLMRKVAPEAVLLTSEEATRRFALLLEGVEHDSPGPSDAIEAFAAAPIVYSTPGITGLIEMCSTRARMVPLPPANYSQVLTIRRFVRAWRSNLSEPWTYLDDAYVSVGDDLPEPEGVAQVMRLNAEQLKSPEFQRRFVEAVGRARDSDLTLPDQFCGPPLGADYIARDIMACLEL